MQALKVLVIVMGALIVIGLGILAWGISMKFGEMAEREEPATAAGPWRAPAEVAIPPGAQVTDTTVDDGYLAITVRLDNGDGRIFIFDLDTGEQIGAVRLNQSEGGQ